MNDPRSAIGNAGEIKNVGRTRVVSWLWAQLAITQTAAAVIIALTIGLLAADVALLRGNDRLKRAVVRANRSLIPAVGAIVPAFLGLDLDGAARAVSYGTDPRDTLLFVFSPDCPKSTAAWPRWLELAQQADRSAVRLVYANVGSRIPADYYARSSALKGAAVLETDARSQVAYNLQVTPLIVRITPDGRIADVLVGRLDANEENRLQRALHIDGLQLLSRVEP